ncbi:MAG TPA: hypothetical protein VFJ12_09855 [Segeticoccus sp.]|nr:hypothetical protein [Segeticoccus sp.]
MLLAAAGGVVVVLVTVIAVLLWQGRSGGAAQAQPSGSPSVAAHQTDDNAIDVALPGRPELEARTGTRRVTFRWSYPDAEPDDTFHLVVGRTTDAVDEKMRTSSFRTTAKPSTTVKASKGGKHRQFCARVQVVRQGVAGPWSGAACERTS